MRCEYSFSLFLKRIESGKVTFKHILVKGLVIIILVIVRINLQSMLLINEFLNEVRSETLVKQSARTILQALALDESRSVTLVVRVLPVELFKTGH